METAWIKVFILTLTQCIAPAGKMICQEETVEYQFASEEDCAQALVQFVDLAARADDILVDRQKTDCKPAVRELTVFANGDDARSSLGASADARVIESETPQADFQQSAHDERLKETRTCEETGGAAPCRIGSIIVEPAAESPRTGVWKQQQ